MKKLLVMTLSFMTLFTVFGEKCALASNSNNKNSIQTFSTRDSRGVRTSYSKVYYSGNTITRIDNYDTRGVRRSTSKVGK